MKHIFNFATALSTFATALMLVIFSACSVEEKPVSITILHTNDTHSQIEPKSNNTGGYARRMGIIAAEREKDPELLLLDAGDFSQGSPYFNFFNGRVEMDALNYMKYDAGTLGNHEFDNGVDTLATILRMSNHPIVCANYVVEGTPLEGLVKPYTILTRKGVRIGIFGLGVNPKGPISPNNFAPLTYRYPVEIANNVARTLKEDEHCDLVICLSHVGTLASDTAICDSAIVAQSRNIDIVIGGHTHQFIPEIRVKDLDGREVLLSQMGKAGVNLGKITVNLEPKGEKICTY